jgi:hypothetical protein
MLLGLDHANLLPTRFLTMATALLLPFVLPLR